MRSMRVGPRSRQAPVARRRPAGPSSAAKRKVLGVAASILLGSSALATGVTMPSVDASSPSFVSRQGQQLMLDGQPFRFTGINIYAANSDGWCGEDYTADQLRTAFDGIGARDTVLRAWFFQTMAAQKGPDGSWTGTRDWSRFDRTLAAAAEKGVHVIVTLTDQWGECGDGGDSGFKTKDWYLGGYNAPDPILAAKYASWVSYRDWVTEVVSRYRDDPTILAWQLVNEAEVKDSLTAGCPVGDPDDPMDHGNILRDFAQDISGLIRGIDANHLISLGTLGGGQCGTQDWQYSLVHALPNIDLCEVHDYSLATMPGDQWNGLQRRLDQCAALDKPLFIGETGITPNDLADKSLDARAELFDAKFRAQFAAGVVGELVWDYRRTGSTLGTFDIGDGDPTLLRIQAWSPGCDPNNYTIVYTDEPHGGNPDLYLFDPVTGARRRVTVDPDHGERQPAWSHGGTRLAYLMNGGSYVYNTDLRTMNVDGSGIAHLVGSNDAPAFQPAWSPDGTRIAYAGSVQGVEQLSVVNTDGTGSQVIVPDPTHGQDSPTWSADGTRIGFSTFFDGQSAIKTIQPDGTGLTTVGFGLGPAWSPDGTRFAFLNSEFNNGYQRSEIYVMNADGTGRVKLSGSLPNDRFYQFGRPNWSGPSRLMFSSGDLNGWSDIYEINDDGTGLTNLTNTPSTSETDAAWRPARTPPVICGPGPQPATPPDAPTNVTAEAGQGSVTVSWQAPANTGGAELLDYRIFANGTSVGGVPANRTSETIESLPAGTYTFTVQTQNIVGPSPMSAPSAPVTVAPQGTPPGAPTSVVAGAGDRVAVVSWVAPSTSPSPGPSSDPGASAQPSNGDNPITAYEVTTHPSGTTQMVAASSTSTTITGLTNGTTYTFTVTAANAIGTGPASDPSGPVTPQAGAPPPQTTTGTIPPAGGTATTDNGAGPTPSDPITTNVTVPSTPTGGSVTIAETAVTETAPAGGYQFVGQQVDITSTVATSASNPLTIVFTVDSSAIRTTFALGPGDPLPAADQVDITKAEGTGNPVPIPPCTAIAPTVVPDPCVSDRRYVNGGDDLRITILTGSASHWNTVVRPATVTVNDSGYTPKTVTVAQGGIVAWTFTGRKAHSATDTLKLGAAKAPLFTSGTLINGRYGYVLRAAATYSYGSTVKGDPGSFAGSVAVPVRINPVTGGTTATFTITWSSATMAGYVFDVQYRFMKSGSKTWSPLKSWQSGTSLATGAFRPPSGTGTYAFSARLRNATTGLAALWSPETSIVVR
jgi:mannan endo-1,4-beta-mannosidase